MAGNLAPLAAAQEAPAVAGHLAFFAGAQPADADDAGTGHGRQDGFARDFATADGQRVMVAVFTQQQFADLARTTRLGGTFAFLERMLAADFSTGADLYAHRGAIAALLAPWFSRRTVAGLAAAFTGTSVPWACIRNLTGIPALSRRNGWLPSPVASWVATLGESAAPSDEIESLKSDDLASPTSAAGLACRSGNEMLVEAATKCAAGRRLEVT
jgi:hypothetical protein